jgi:hypothetical protein
MKGAAVRQHEIRPLVPSNAEEAVAPAQDIGRQRCRGVVDGWEYLRNTFVSIASNKSLFIPQKCTLHKEKH